MTPSMDTSNHLDLCRRGFSLRGASERALGPGLPLAGLSLAGLLLALGGCAQNCNPQPSRPPNSCLSCHQPDGVGIENAHPYGEIELGCVDCHGGDPEQATKELAHVQGPPGVTSIKGAPTDVLSNLPTDYLLFINPGDLRVADIGCGVNNRRAGIQGCHQGLVESVGTSVMTTFVGHYNVPRYLAGLQDRDAIYGVRDMIVPDYDEATAPEGTVGALQALRPDPDAPRGTVQTVMDNYLVKSCTHCHAYSYGWNNAPGLYRSSGCSSCHMVYDNYGLSESGDPMIVKSRPPHPVTHEITTKIPTDNCVHCHFQGGRIGILFQGLREGGFRDTPEYAEFLGESLFDHGPDFYLKDEDTTNDVDETPPDLHYQAGMACVDCHVGRDVHGDGNIYSSAKFQIGIKCQDCHGTVRAPAEEGDDGYFHATGGHVLPQLSRTPTGEVVVTTQESFGGVSLQLRVPQVYDILQSGSNPNMVEAMGVDPETDWSHTDSLECYACHTHHRQSCFGCHVEMDDRFEQIDHQTGKFTQGLVVGRRDYYSIDDFFLGENRLGKVTTVCPSEQMFISYTNEDGEKIMDEWARRTASGRLGFGWQPNNQHTVSKVPQKCSRCHIKEDESNIVEARATYGFGSGKVFLSDGDGVQYDLTQILDDAGTPIVDFAHEGVSSVSKERIQRALSIRVPNDK